MKKKTFLFPTIILLFLYGCHFNNAKKEVIQMKELEIHEFVKILEDRDKLDEPISVKFTGKTEESPEKKEKYLYYEVVMFSGTAGEPGESYTILHHSESDLFMNPTGKDYSSFKIKIHWRVIRPYIKEVNEKKFTGENSSSAPVPVQEALKEEGTDYVRLVELGIKQDKEYYILFDEEGYYLPPERPDSKPRRKTNRVILISDLPFKDGDPQTELSPLFKCWGY